MTDVHFAINESPAHQTLRCDADSPQRFPVEAVVNCDGPDILVEALQAASQLQFDNWTCVALAASLSMHERTLRKKCVAVGIPGPQWLLGWTKLLLSGILLRDPKRTVENIANSLQYSTPSAYRRALKSYVGCTARELRLGDPPMRIAASMQAAMKAVRQIPPSH